MRGKHLRGLRDPNTHDIVTVYHSQNTTQCVCLCAHCVGGECSRNMAYGSQGYVSNAPVKSSRQGHYPLPITLCDYYTS